MPVQIHETLDNKTLYINFEEVVTGNRTAHKYSMRTEKQLHYGDKVDGVTSIIKNVDDASGLMDWAIYEAERSGVPDQARRLTKQSIESGLQLHASIENYIKYGKIDRSNKTFMNWYHCIDETDWKASEVYVFDRTYLYGGTIDALSWEPSTEEGVPGHYVIHDFKTKNTKSYNNYQVYQKDRCQLAAYARALRSMNSIYYPIMEGKLHYIMRDSDKVEVQTIDLGHYEDMFIHSWKLYDFVKRDKYKKQKQFRLGG